MNPNRYMIPKPNFSNRNVSKSNCRNADTPKMIAMIVKVNFMLLLYKWKYVNPIYDRQVL